MAIKAGQILHVMNQFVVDRIQTGGPGDLNIPQDKVYELGNYQSVGIVRNVPDLSFNLDCLDVDTEVEALLTGSTNPYADSQGHKYELAKNVAIDIVSPWKSPYGTFAAVQGVAMPNLALASANYRYGLTDNAGETFTLNGDSIYYIPGTPWQDIAVGDATTVEYEFEHPDAILYKEGATSFYALSVSVDGNRLTQIDRADLADATTLGDELVYAPLGTAQDGIEFAIAPDTGAKISIIYGSDESASYTQTGDTPYGSGTANLVHQSVAVKPAAIRGKDIDVYFATLVSVGGGITNKALTSNVATLTTASAHGLTTGDVVTIAGVDGVFDGTYTLTGHPTSTTFTYALTNANVASQADLGGRVGKPIEVRWPDVQSANIQWQVTLEQDYEFGNARAVAREATDVPAVTGSVELRPRSVEALFTRMRQLTGVDTGQVIGPQSSVAGGLRIEIRNPDSGGSAAVAAGTVLKTHYIPDARFTIPGYSGQVQQKLNVTVNFESDGGILETYKGARS